MRGYHKPIMLAGGVGNVRPGNALKGQIRPGSAVIVLGGPGMPIGLGGGAASSLASGAADRADLDFASVQRENPELERRCQEVIDGCANLPAGNPIQSIHDVGAGGLSNALPELVHDAGLGAHFELRDVPIASPGMSPMEIWCNESQERYVLAVTQADLPRFEAIAKRERCPYAVVGTATTEQRLLLTDKLFGTTPIDLPMDVLFGKAPKIGRSATSLTTELVPFDASLGAYLTTTEANEASATEEAVNRVLHLPSVGSKAFLITIGDRSVTSLVAQEPMVGPWQVPVADVAVTHTSYGFDAHTGEAMATGERTPVALISAAASARMAVAEALTNLVAADIGDDLTRVKLSANWMAAAGHGDEGKKLYDAVQAVGLDLCPKLGLAIPVGKDSMSMKMAWTDASDGQNREVTSPLSLIITAFSPVYDTRLTWTPCLRTDVEDTVLVLVDLAGGQQRLGGSALAQVFRQLGDEAPDVESADVLGGFVRAANTLRRLKVESRPATAGGAGQELVLAYHDRSDGGLFAAVAEMCFAARTGVTLDLASYAVDNSTAGAHKALFNEELGAVLQVRRSDVKAVKAVLVSEGVPAKDVHVLGAVQREGTEDVTVTTHGGATVVLRATRAALQKAWAETSWRMQAMRDNSHTADSEYALIGLSAAEATNRLSYQLTYNPGEDVLGPLGFTGVERPLGTAPMVAILREQGVNSHIEMAWAWHQAGFTVVDVHTSDLASGRVTLDAFRGLAACGGFSFGDVLGAGGGWAKSLLLNAKSRRELETFLLHRTDTFAIGVCNGCQMLSELGRAGLIPGGTAWPAFKGNTSGRYEARQVMVEVDKHVSGPFLRLMAGSRLPIVVSHGEGRAVQDAHVPTPAAQIAMRYVDNAAAVANNAGGGRGPTETYPSNPNGSAGGVTGVQSSDGRVLAMMPHPERCLFETNMSHPAHPSYNAWNGRGPWFRLFESARLWVEEHPASA